MARPMPQSWNKRVQGLKSCAEYLMEINRLNIASFRLDQDPDIDSESLLRHEERNEKEAC